MEVFFIKYRKILLAASIFMFLYFLYEMYKGIESINLKGSGSIGEGIGTLIDACITLFLSIYFFVNVRKASRKLKEQNTTSSHPD